MIGSGEDHAAVGLLQAQNVALFPPLVRLPPALPAVIREEEPAAVFIVDHAHVHPVGVLAVDDHATDHAMRKSAVRADVMVNALVAGEYAAAIGCQQHALGTARIDEI